MGTLQEQLVKAREEIDMANQIGILLKKVRKESAIYIHQILIEKDIIKPCSGYQKAME